MVYEVVTFQALREQLRCKAIWVVGARSWRNPDEDLPADFSERRVENYAELRKPLGPAVFVHDLRREMTSAPEELNTAVPGLEWLSISARFQAAEAAMQIFASAPDSATGTRRCCEPLPTRLVLQGRQAFRRPVTHSDPSR